MRYFFSIIGIPLIAVVSCTAQNDFIFSTVALHSKVLVTNNYGPQRQIEGDSRAYGTSISYVFHPNFLTLPKHLFFGVGVGYYRQEFNIRRPFHYYSPAEVLYYTRKYSYDSYNLLTYLKYDIILNYGFSLPFDLSYAWMRSFRQKFTPTYGAPEVAFHQIEHNRFHFGSIISTSVGVKKKWGRRISTSIALIVPLRTRWRKDQIFDDDSSHFFGPTASKGDIRTIGFSVGCSYTHK